MLMNGSSMNEEEFEQFLKWLDEDRELAAQKYEKLRHSLIRYFVKRQCASAEDLADVVLDAAIGHLHKQNSLLLTKPLPYIYGIARNVYRQYFNRQPSVIDEIDWNRILAPDYSEERARAKRLSECLRNCLQALEEEDRELFLLYYLKKTKALDTYRLRLALSFDMTINGLRLKMMRLRERLRLCIASCEQNSDV